MAVMERTTDEGPQAGGAEHHETVIVGGGQAGLSTAYHLKKLGRECLVLDANERVGDSWRQRWPSLRLYSPAVADGLPGMRFPAKRYAFPSGLEMADYLEVYAERFELPVLTGTWVDSLSRNGKGYVVRAGGQAIEADNVVVAAGCFTDPYVPELARELDPGITQLHSRDYRSPEQLADGPVLVVGASHSGADIAFEVAGAGHATILSGRDTGQLPFRVDSRIARIGWPFLRFAWLHLITMRTPLGRKARAHVRCEGGLLLRVRSGDLAQAGVERVRARTVGVVEGRPQLADGRILDVANVVWCTGFKNRYEWIDVPIPMGEDGFPEQERGVVPGLPGLYFTGLLFQYAFSSMLILGAGRDAKHVAKHIASRPARVAA
jgi:putative flavoprotein involved in K+ transport